jgi:hypothetical protein
MANETRSDQRAAPERDRDRQRPPPPSTQSAPPILNDGLELPRSSDC